MRVFLIFFIRLSYFLGFRLLGSLTIKADMADAFIEQLIFVPVSKIVRVIRQAHCNMLLVGIGGSGRHSFTNLASYICEYATFQIEVTKQYRRTEFRDGECFVMGNKIIYVDRHTFVCNTSSNSAYIFCMRVHTRSYMYTNI